MRHHPPSPLRRQPWWPKVRTVRSYPSGTFSILEPMGMVHTRLISAAGGRCPLRSKLTANLLEDELIASSLDTKGTFSHRFAAGVCGGRAWQPSMRELGGALCRVSPQAKRERCTAFATLFPPSAAPYSSIHVSGILRRHESLLIDTSHGTPCTVGRRTNGRQY